MSNRKLGETLNGGTNGVPENKVAKLASLRRFTNALIRVLVFGASWSVMSLL
jgi:hypothetical protein